LQKKKKLKQNKMKRFSGYLIVGSETKQVEVIADTMNPDSTCATRFYKQVKRTGLYRTPETGFDLIAQYPTDRLIIDSIEEFEEQ
jgi:hypothetical protein